MLYDLWLLDSGQIGTPVYNVNMFIRYILKYTLYKFLFVFYEKNLKLEALDTNIEQIHFNFPKKKWY